MKVETKKLPQSEMELLMEIDAKEWDKFIIQAIQNLSRFVKIEGFRPGMAPRQIAEQKIGLGKILETAADLAVRQIYPEALRQEKIDAIGQPEINVLKIAPDNPFS
ncbi:MAG: trigger factor family protein, partial [Patescibacteria group bacterium]